MREELKKRENENLLSFYKRITDNKTEYDLDYSEWGELLLGEKKYSSENCRKAFYILKPILEKLSEEEIKTMPKNKIEEITDLIGELDVKKQEVRNKTNKLNRIKRDFVKSIEIANDIKESLIENTEIPSLNYDKIIIDENCNNKLIVQISDWHLGYYIPDYKGNSYNIHIAKKRIEKLLSEVNKTINQYDIKEVVVANCGDMIEQVSMRGNQSYECELDLSHQISMASKLIYSFLVSITEMEVNVTYCSVGGNHMRIVGNKDHCIEGDSCNVIIHENIKDFVELSKNKRVSILECDYKDDSSVFEINGMNVKVVHGDNKPFKDKQLIDGESSVDKTDYKLILRGHFHNFNMSYQNNNSYVITGGCLFGYNTYSTKRMQCKTNACQTLIVVGKDDIECIKNINLQIN